MDRIAAEGLPTFAVVLEHRVIGTVNFNVDLGALLLEGRSADGG